MASIAFVAASVAIAVSNFAGAQSVAHSWIAQVPAPAPSFVPWYTASPAPIPSANAAIGASFGARNFYDSTAFLGQVPGNALIDTHECNFVCYGAPGTQSHHVIIYGNDVDPGLLNTSFTHDGAANDCNIRPLTYLCPGAVPNRAFGVTVDVSPAPRNPYYLALDESGNLGVVSGIYAAGAIIAGAGAGTPNRLPRSSNGSLVSYTKGGAGDLLLGSSDSYVACDYGETAPGRLTCNRPFNAVSAATAGFNSSSTVWTSNAVLPHSSSASGSVGYVPEMFPLGIPSQHPQMLSGECAPSARCVFPYPFSFPDTNFTCSVTAQGSTPVESSYVVDSSNSITIYASPAPSAPATISYICAH